MSADAGGTLVDVEVVAEDAPLNVLLWPVREPRYAVNYTLERVVTERMVVEEAGAIRERVVVRWHYMGGNVRSFHQGEGVACRVTPDVAARIQRRANWSDIVLTAEQIAAWVGRPLTPEETQELDDAIPNSSIPEAIATIVGGLA